MDLLGLEVVHFDSVCCRCLLILGILSQLSVTAVRLHMDQETRDF